MPQVTVAEGTYQRLTERASDLGVTVEQLVAPALDQIVSNDLSPLSALAWQREFNSWLADIAARAGRYPREHSLRDGRDEIYYEREDAQR